MIIKHIVELETVINEEANEVTVYRIKGMSEEERQQFFTAAATSFIGDVLANANKGHSWAELRLTNKESV
jgi:hypothetical protein